MKLSRVVPCVVKADPLCSFAGVVSSFGTSAFSTVLVFIRIDVPKHWVLGDSSLCFDKFCNISDSNFSFQILGDVVSPFPPSLS